MMRSALPAFEKPSSTRSANMRAVRSRENRSTEWRVRSRLIRGGHRGWKLHSTKFVGTPDFAFPKARVVIFIDGCFWHGCPRCGHIPKTNQEYWSAKILRNQSRDRRYSRTLRYHGFKVIRIWECTLRKNPQKCLERILSHLA
ncbi:MAG TPA: very short patch repair endonuclease [Blastocatellia bacterium]|nr:very short patch repair endonuclease [Blastocatellia bacterium]